MVAETQMVEVREERLLRLPQVLKMISIGKSSWWAGIKNGKYPPGRKLSARTTVWLYSDIVALIDNLKKS